MNEVSLEAIEQSGYRRAGFAEHYDAYRPAPPAVLLDTLTRYVAGPPLIVWSISAAGPASPLGRGRIGRAR